MGKNKAEKKRLKRKTKQKKKRIHQSAAIRGEKLEYLIFSAEHHLQFDQFDQALVYLRKALRVAPAHINLLRQLGYVGQRIDGPKLKSKPVRGSTN